MDSRIFESELGWFVVTATASGVTNLSFGLATQATALTKCREYQQSTGPDEQLFWLDKLQAALIRYAQGQPVDLRRFPIAPRELTEFQERVIAICQAIPRGETLTYGQAARLAGSPGAARAVGQVMASNRVPLLIPCHRVVGSSGLGGFTAPGGLPIKQRLLDLERDNSGQLPRKPKKVVARQSRSGVKMKS